MNGDDWGESGYRPSPGAPAGEVPAPQAPGDAERYPSPPAPGPDDGWPRSNARQHPAEPSPPHADPWDASHTSTSHEPSDYAPHDHEQPPSEEWNTYTPPVINYTGGDDGLPPGQVPWSDDDGGGSHTQSSGGRTSRMLVRELVETGLMALLVFLAVRASFQNYRVHGHSMDPTLQDGEFLLVNRIEYAQVNVDKLSNFIPFLHAGSDPTRDVFHGPERGDVIILEDPRNPAGDRLVKRVIGLPGEKIEIVNGAVYIDGRLLHEPYITEPWTGSAPAQRIPADQYFVMGDNRKNSEDSRYFGLVPRDLVIGKAMVAFWPKDKLGSGPSETPTLDPVVTR